MGTDFDFFDNLKGRSQPAAPSVILKNGGYASSSAKLPSALACSMTLASSIWGSVS